MPRPRPLAVEILEDRTTPTTFGVAWPDPLHLTLSFEPDGTRSADGTPSALFQTLNTDLSRTLGTANPTALWQTEILRAFQAWAVNANINIGVVADDGSPEGAAGPVQGDTHFGDIRIGTYPLAPDVVAVATPFDYAAGTWSGEVHFNSNLLYTVGPSAAAYDVFTVMLHEAGHVFGLPDDADPTSALFENFTSVRSGPSAANISALQDLYGVRGPDAFDAKSDNGTLATATSLTPGSASDSTSGTLTADGDLTALNDADFYQFKPSGKAGTVTITLHTAGLSLLVPTLTVYDDLGQQLAAPLTRMGPLGSDLTFQLDLSQVQHSSRLYIEVSSGTQDVFGIGGYELQISDAGLGGQPSSSGTGGNAGPSASTNSSPGTAVNLQPKVFRSDARFDYSYQASLTSAGAVDYYRFKAPNANDGPSSIMTVMVWPTNGSALEPVATLYDAQGNPVAAQVLVNEDGSFILQVDNVAPNAQYILAVSDSAGATGNYYLGVSFDGTADELTTLVNQQAVDSSHPVDGGTLTVSKSQLFHFILSANGTAGAGVPAGQLTVRDAAGNVVLTLNVATGETQTATLFLLPGVYQVAYAANLAAGPTTYTLQVDTISDPIGPNEVDTSLSPGASPDAPAFTWQAGLTTTVTLNGPPPGGSSPSPGTGATGTTGDGTGSPTPGTGTTGTAGSGGTTSPGGTVSGNSGGSVPSRADLNFLATINGLLGSTDGGTINSIHLSTAAAGGDAPGSSATARSFALSGLVISAGPGITTSPGIPLVFDPLTLGLLRDAGSGTVQVPGNAGLAGTDVRAAALFAALSPASRTGSLDGGGGSDAALPDRMAGVMSGWGWLLEPGAVLADGGPSMPADAAVVPYQAPTLFDPVERSLPHGRTAVAGWTPAERSDWTAAFGYDPAPEDPTAMLFRAWGYTLVILGAVPVMFAAWRTTRTS